MIMDKGKEIATGTKDELKTMIRTGEKITIEIYDLPEDILAKINDIDDIVNAEYDDNRLTASCRINGHALISILDILRKNNLSFGRVFSEPPTLNDVFLEITGRQLRD